MITTNKRRSAAAAAEASKNPNAAVSAAAANAQAEPAQGSFSSMMNGLASLLTVNRTVRDIENESEDPAMRALYGHALDFKDMTASTGDLVGMTGQIEALNVTAREAIFEPILIERLFAVHSAFKSNVNALVGSFNAAGDITLLGVTGQGLVIQALAAVRPAFLGLAIRLKAANLEDGDTTLRVIKAATGFDATFALTDSVESGVIVVLNHAQDTTVTDSLVPGALVGTDVGLTATEVSAVVSQQYYFDYSGTTDWRMEGRNATVHTYLLVVNLELCALVYACIVEDRMKDLPNLIAAAYQSAKK